LGDVTKLKGDLGDLTHVEASSLEARWEAEAIVAAQLNLDEVLEGHDVVLIEGLLEGVEDHNGLLMSKAAEGVGADHVEHGLDDLAAQDVSENGGLLDAAALS